MTTPQVHIRNVMFKLKVGMGIFSNLYSDNMATNTFTDMEYYLISKHDLLQSLFITVNLMKHIHCKHYCLGEPTILITVK